MTRIGLIGLGRMGQAAGERLLGAGHALAVHNRTADKAAPLRDLGARWADTPAQLVEEADVVLTMLANDQAVTDTYCGPHGLLSGAGAPGTLFVEMSTVRTVTALRLHGLVAARGARLVDAPMSGPPAAVRAGQLLVLAGGNAADVEQATDVVGEFSRRVVHLGPHGAGTTMKLVLQLPMAVLFASLGEALSIGTQFGLSVDSMLDVILDSQGAPPVLHNRANIIRAGSDAPADAGVGFDVAGVRKDLQAMVATAQDAGVPATTAGAALGVFAGATAGGYADRDLAAIVDYLIRLAAAVAPEPGVALAGGART
jgi:3-hydroxyisobutyrate dehydrogenase-like beta-hydroxyacid dehydrogenase